MLTSNQIKELQAQIEKALASLKESSEILKYSHTDAELIFRQRRRLEAALLRIENRTFGICCDCQEALPFEELNTNPAAPFCSSCQEEREVNASELTKNRVLGVEIR
jgi:RNA polymerase-binding transcription factor DksA